MTQKEIITTKLDKIRTISNDMKIIIDNEPLKQKLTSVENKVISNTVSIGVTGIIKAGKSTLLNAILHKDILGTAIVPETANLTIIKYSDTENAIVNFWSKSEWDDIIKSSENDNDLKEWIEKTNESIPELSSYITETGLKKEISIDELPKYTSAKKKYNSMCNIVKYIELYTPLKYVKGGVEIIDTPGIDDPVVRREQITQDFLTECDIMIHAMNSVQAFTLKDATFIIDNILMNSVSKLILVITRKDDRTKNELDDVIYNIKESIIKKFEEYKKDNELLSSKFNNILENIEIVSISGKDALNHRIGKSNKTKLPLEETGILELERILDKLLFQDNPKYDFLFNTSKKELLDVSTSYMEILENDKKIQSKSLDTIDKEINQITLDQVKFDSDSKVLLNDINKTKDDFKNSLERIRKDTIEKTYSLSNYVNNEVKNYLYEELNKGNKPDEDKIKEIIETSIKSNMVNILESYQKEIQYEIKYYIKNISENYNNYKTDYNPPIILEEYDFDFDKLFGQGDDDLLIRMGIGGISGYIIGGLGVAIFGPILGIVASFGVIFGGTKLFTEYSKDKIDKQISDIEKKLNEALSDIFSKITKDTDDKIKELNKIILDKFNETAYSPYEEISQKLISLKDNLTKKIDIHDNSKTNLNEQNLILENTKVKIKELNYQLMDI